MMDLVAGLTWIDWSALGIMLASCLIGVVRGVVREIFSLLGWVLAFWLAKTYSLTGAHWLASLISSETVRLIAAFALIFLAGLVLTGLLGHAFNALVSSAGLGALNRVLGGLFGLLRGALLVVILVLLAGMTALPKQREWRASGFVAWGEQGGRVLLPYLPSGMAERIHF